jgi:two-component system, LytTR family, sensor kinase
MRATNRYLKWRLAILFLGAWTLVGLILAALSYAATIGALRRLTLSEALWVNLVQFYIWGALSLLIVPFTRRFPIEFRPLKVPNLLLHIPIIFLFATVHQGIHLFVLWFLMPNIRQSVSIADYYRAYFGFGVYLDLMIASLIVTVAHAFIYYRNLRTGEVQQAQLKSQLVRARLEALTMQLHPHFLFNTLHSISSLILEDPARANSMIARLGDFLRLTLEHSNQQLVMLNEEVEFLRCYLEIEQVRFEDRLKVHFNIEPRTLSAYVPHWILQPIVENAIQYAIAPRATSGWIKIEAKRLHDKLWLQVIDNGPGLKTHNASVEKLGVGLSNVRARLDQLYGPSARLKMTNNSDGGLAVVLEMPFRLAPV